MNDFQKFLNTKPSDYRKKGYVEPTYKKLILQLSLIYLGVGVLSGYKEFLHKESIIQVFIYGFIMFLTTFLVSSLIILGVGYYKFKSKKYNKINE